MEINFKFFLEKQLIIQKETDSKIHQDTKIQKDGDTKIVLQEEPGESNTDDWLKSEPIRSTSIMNGFAFNSLVNTVVAKPIKQGAVLESDGDSSSSSKLKRSAESKKNKVFPYKDLESTSEASFKRPNNAEKKEKKQPADDYEAWWERNSKQPKPAAIDSIDLVFDDSRIDKKKYTTRKLFQSPHYSVFAYEKKKPK